MRDVVAVLRKIETSLQMSRGSDNIFNLRIRDVRSGLEIMEIEIPDTHFADLLSTRTTESCKTTYFQSDKIGKKHENITVQLKLPEPSVCNT